MKNYKIAVAGTGYVGLSLSVLLAQHNQVMAVDIVQAKVDMMVFLSAGQCAIGNGDAFVPAAAITGDGSTSNADWWIRDFYDTAGGRQRDRASGTGGSNASAGMVHIK